VANARFVVLDAQGLVPVRRRSKTKQIGTAAAPKQAGSKPAQATSASSSSAAAVSISRETVQTVKTPADSSRWVDGSRFERDHYDADEDEDSSDGDRKLSKSDRKRLRKIKAQGRAA
jgi:hypothetical protein